MATDSTGVNGMYDGQFTQPAELAATTPSHAASASQSSATASTQQQKADPQEIGWYFVEQYYTTLSKSPERIHLFYSKKSQLVTGQEAEKVLPAVGTKAISEKIKSLDIQDCKVRVLNVDSQLSYDNIVVQVIGEMSNKSEPHHKFVQTFILATQPNGYFVLNDIFRYLNDEEDEIIEDEPAHEETASEAPVTQAEAPVATLAAEETVNTEEAADEVDEKLEEVKEEEREEEQEEEAASVDQKPNGVDEPVAPEPISSNVSETKDSAVEADESLTVEQPVDPEPSPVQGSPKVAPAADAAPTKKTWASLVGAKAPAVPALPQATSQTATATAVSAPNQPKSQKPTQPTQTPKAAVAAPAAAAAAADADSASQSNGWQTADHGKKTRNQQSKVAEGIVHAYIKNVTDKIEAQALKEVLEKYGELKYYDVSRPKQSAFVEFASPAGYAAAVAANPHTVGTEQINVEERRPRPGQYGGNNAQFNRGGNAGRGRGGLQQRPGNQGNNFPREGGRGGFQQRGKPGNVTPKGRGQAQPA